MRSIVCLKRRLSSRLFSHEYLRFSILKIAVDADGAPDAYNPTDTGVDYLANAVHCRVVFHIAI